MELVCKGCNRYYPRIIYRSQNLKTIKDNTSSPLRLPDLSFLKHRNICDVLKRQIAIFKEVIWQTLI